MRSLRSTNDRRGARLICACSWDSCSAAHTAEGRATQGQKYFFVTVSMQCHDPQTQNMPAHPHDTVVLGVHRAVHDNDRIPCSVWCCLFHTDCLSVRRTGFSHWLRGPSSRPISNVRSPSTSLRCGAHVLPPQTAPLRSFEVTIESQPQDPPHAVLRGTHNQPTSHVCVSKPPHSLLPFTVPSLTRAAHGL